MLSYLSSFKKIDYHFTPQNILSINDMRAALFMRVWIFQNDHDDGKLAYCTHIHKN